jgi:hypothetical protein
MYDKTALTYETYETETHGYRMTHVVVRRMYQEDVAVHLAGTVDNKAGYGTLEAAKQQARRFQSMLDANHTTYFDTTLSGLQVHVRWQHYYGSDGILDYCEPAYEDLGRSLSQIEEGLKFLKDIGRRIEKIRAKRSEKTPYPHHLQPVSNHTFSCPQEMLEALAHMKETMQVRRDFDGWVLTDVKMLGPARAA